MKQSSKAATHLFDAKTSRQRIPAIPSDCRPADASSAYDVQDALVEQLKAQNKGRVAGYKIGCTNTAAQEFLGLAGPFFGRLLSNVIFDSPTQLPASDFFMVVIEPEFAFEMAADLPIDGAYTEDQVADAIGALMPAIEIVDSCYVDWTTAGAMHLIADNGCNGAWVKGAATTDWRKYDLAQHSMQLIVNGEVNQTGRGDVVLGHPLKALTWLANALSARGLGLKAGELISTGVCVDKVYDAQPGDKIEADFGTLGKVTLSVDVA